MTPAKPASFICPKISRGEAPQGTGGSAPHSVRPQPREV